MSHINRLIVVGLTALCAAACSKPAAPQVDLMDRSRDIFLLLRYDTNNDRRIDKDEMEAGLKRDYDAADLNHDGKLDAAEVQAENQRRWQAEGPQSSPLMDWNMDGNISMSEFAGAVHSLFATVDRNKDNTITVQELQAPRGIAPPTPRLDPRTGVPGGTQSPQTQPGQVPTGGSY